MFLRHLRDHSLAILAHRHGVIGRSHRRSSRYRRVINGPYRTTPSLALVELAKPGGKCRFRKPLHLEVERGEYFKPAFVDHRLAVLRDQQLPDVFHKIGRELIPARTPEGK